MDRLSDLLSQVTPFHLEILKVCIVFAAMRFGAVWVAQNLTWVTPALFSFTRKVWADDKADTTVKLTTSAFPLILDTTPAWGGALAGWFLAPDGVSHAYVAGLSGAVATVFTSLLLGVRWKETLPQLLDKAISDFHRTNLTISRTQEELRLDVAALQDVKEDQALELDMLTERLAETSKRGEKIANASRTAGEAADAALRTLELHTQEVAKLRGLLTGEEKDALKVILGLDLEKTVKAFRNEVNTQLRSHRKHVDSEITKCVGLVEKLIPGMDASLEQPAYPVARTYDPDLLEGLS
jgi:hypothetical protein